MIKPFSRARILLIAVLLASAFQVNANTLTPAAANELKEISLLAEKGQQAAALERINTFLTSNPNDPQAMFMKGVVLVELNRRDDAIKAFTDLSEKYPNLPEPYNNLAVLYADMGQYEKSKKALETAIKTHPSYATAHENLGDIYARMASEAYDKALQLDNSNARAQSKLAMIKDIFDGKTSGKSPVAVAAKPATSTQPIRPADKPVADKKVEPAKPAAIVEEKSPAPAAGQEGVINEAVSRWAKAWSNKDIDAYLASYSDTFKPAKGMSRKEWEQMRRQRINRPKTISVEVMNAKTTVDGNKAEISFKQKYVADGKPQKTDKTLIMKKQGDTWLIDEEIASN